MDIVPSNANYYSKYLASFSPSQNFTPSDLIDNLNSYNLSAYDLVIAAKQLTPSDPNLKKIEQLISERLLVKQSSASPDEIRAFLISSGILPTAEEAKRIFWSLGEDWWKQILDGEYHKHGKMVFDQDLHGGGAEPGYLKGVEAGGHYFSDRFNQNLDVNLYRGIHHEACAHFKGGANNTLCDASKIDDFRREEEQCHSPQLTTEYKNLAEGLKKLDALKRDIYNFDTIDEKSPWRTTPVTSSEREQLKEKAHLAREWIIQNIDPSYALKTDKELHSILYNLKEDLCKQRFLLQEKAERTLENEFSETAARLNLDQPYVVCKLTSDALYLYYSRSDQIEKITTSLMTEFNENIEVLQKKIYVKIDSTANSEALSNLKDEYQNQVIPLIARLYAELEWLHPWIDGQGRTDLILLNGLLSKEGVHPCILDEPYFSSFSPVADWINYLKQGLSEFEKVYVNHK